MVYKAKATIRELYGSPDRKVTTVFERNLGEFQAIEAALAQIEKRLDALERK